MSTTVSTLHVRSVPTELYDRIRQQAQSKNRSISAEVIMLLTQAMHKDRQSQAALLSNIQRRRFFNPKTAGAPDSTTLLREDRER